MIDVSRFYRGKAFDLEYAVTFNSIPVKISDVESGLERKVPEAAKYGISYAATEFWLNGWLGLYIPESKLDLGSAKVPYRLRIRKVEEADIGHIQRLMYLDVLEVAKEKAAIQPAVNRPTEYYGLKSGENMSYNDVCLNHNIKDGDEFNVAISKQGGEGDFFARFSRRQSAILKDPLIPLSMGMKVRIKVMMARGTQYFSKVLQQLDMPGRLTLQMTRQEYIS